MEVCLSSFSKNWIYITLALITLLGLQLRLQSVRYTVVNMPIRADAMDYLYYAINLKVFNTYSRSTEAVEGKVASPKPDAVRSPGYPLFLRFFIVDSDVQTIIFNISLAQALLSTLTIVLVYFSFVGFLSPPPALLAAFFTALSPHLVNSNIYLLSETLFCFLLMLFFWLLTRLRSNPSYFLLLATGLALGLSTLTRPWTQYFIVLLIPLLAIGSPLVRPYRAGFLISLGFVIPIGFWIVRNLSTLGIITDDTLAINALHHGLYPDMMYDHRPETLGYPYKFDPHSSEIAASLTSVRGEVIKRFIEYPWEYIKWYLFGKPVMLFSWDMFANGGGDIYIYPVLRTAYNEFWLFKASHSLMFNLHSYLVVLAGLGSALPWLPAKYRLPGVEYLFITRCLSALFLYFVLVHCVGAPFARYSIPMQPIVYGLAMLAFRYGLTQYKTTKRHAGLQTQEKMD